MSKIKLISVVGISLLLLGTSVQTNLGSSPNDVIPKFRGEMSMGLASVQPGNVQTAIDQGFVFPNSAIESFPDARNTDEYMTIYTGKPSVFQKDVYFDSKIKSLSAISPSPEPPSPGPASPEPPSPDPPSPRPTVPGT